jgi:MOSC domain-containing protein YiiM
MQTHPQIFAICRGIVTPLFGINHPDYKMVPSGIKKSAIDPHAGSILVKTLGIEGDEQADFNVHGGQEKAIYAYPREHYDFWEDYLQRAGRQIPTREPGLMGENLSVLGIKEDEVWVGDRWQIGTVELQVTKLREPCFKFNARMGYNGCAKAMVQSGHCGWYLRVNQGGSIQVGDTITVIPGKREISISMQNQLLAEKTRQQDLL